MTRRSTDNGVHILHCLFPHSPIFPYVCELGRLCLRQLAHLGVGAGGAGTNARGGKLSFSPCCMTGGEGDMFSVAQLLPLFFCWSVWRSLLVPEYLDTTV